MPPPLADNLVVVLPPASSLRAWAESGLFAREWAMILAIAGRYERIVVVTFNGDDERAAFDGLPEHIRAKHSLVCNSANLPRAAFVDRAGARVRELLPEGQSALVRTKELAGGDAAVAIVEALRAQGRTAGLMARGAFLWTRYIAHAYGPHSRIAADSAEHEKLLCRSADIVAGTSDRMVEDLAWRYGIDPARTVVVPNYVLPVSDDEQVGSKEDGLILCVGRLVARKRIGMLIDAVAQIARHNPAAHLEVVGDGPLRTELESHAEGANANVRFIQSMPYADLRRRMRECCVFAAASELEGQAKTVLDAMASGAPVVVADTPGLGGLVQHGVTGLKVAGATDAFAHVLQELLNDAEWREVLGASAARATLAAHALPVVLNHELAAHERTMQLAAARQARAAA
ncbi:MAG TPA: glycosyltransferase family 4 protein [Phycisphaerales bacterium]|nr:glycosyltransferase family 4 protein [Phycisphaerales bacterium]